MGKTQVLECCGTIFNTVKHWSISIHVLLKDYRLQF